MSVPQITRVQTFISANVIPTNSPESSASGVSQTGAGIALSNSMTSIIPRSPD